MTVASVERRGLQTLCRLLGVTRQAYYQQKSRVERIAFRSELVVQEVTRIRQVQKRLGVRKLYFMMSGFLDEHRIGIGRDGLFELLREHSLLVRKRRSRKPRTTFSCRWMRHYPNLAKDFIPLAPNRLWVSDITYIRIGEGFGYLSLVTDAYSRKIVGYHLSERLSANGCVAALKMALKNNRQREGLIHHSDRGLQYHSTAYVELLAPDVRISMTEKSDPLENAIAERVNGILKDELLKRRFAGFAEARQQVAQAVKTYNHLRPHLSVDMLTPAAAHTQTGVLKRHWKNYYTNNKMEAAQAMARAIA